MYISDVSSLVSNRGKGYKSRHLSRVAFMPYVFHKGFTLIEMLVVIAILGTLAGLLLPALVAARESGRETTCRNNMRQIGLAFEMYTTRYGGYFMGSQYYKQKLVPFAPIEPTNDKPGIFGCPSRPELPWFYGHGYNVGVRPFLHKDAPPPQENIRGFGNTPDGGVAEARVRNRDRKIVIAEWDRCLGGPPVGKPDLFPPGVGSGSFWAVSRVHRGASNVLFADWHVETLEPDTYHSRLSGVDEDGQPILGDYDNVYESAVNISTWRRYWDVDSPL